MISIFMEFEQIKHPFYFLNLVVDEKIKKKTIGSQYTIKLASRVSSLTSYF